MRNKYTLEQLALASLAVDCPPPEHLADYTLGILTGNEQLRIAAHVRQCPLCQEDVAVSQPPEPVPQRVRLRTLLARAVPLALGEGRRSAGGEQRDVRRFVAADLIVELTIAPPADDVWRITGQVLRADEALVGIPVTMSTPGRRYRQETNAAGFFTFEDIEPGVYQVSVRHGNVRVQIANLEFTLP